jgi:ATP-dependent Zn protease
MKNTILYLILIAGLFFGCSEKKTEITSADFQRLLMADSIQSISVLNDESVTIITKSSDFNGNQYKFSINSSNQFKQKLDDLTKEYTTTHSGQPYTSISYIRGSSNFGIIIIIELVLIICLLILFLVSAIDILKSRFASDIEKLIWILLVIFVPVFGPIIYLCIGRKQKVKNIE